jgi:hypothetical protein
MKILFCSSIITICIASHILFGAEVSDTNELSGAKEGVRILMKFNVGTNGGASKGPSTIIVTVTNNSSNDVSLGWPTVGAPVWFAVTLPSGKDLTTPEPGAQMMGSTKTRPVVPAHEASEFSFQLNDICPLEKAGTYHYAAKVRVFYSNSNSVVTSSPVAVSLSDADIKALESSGDF